MARDFVAIEAASWMRMRQMVTSTDSQISFWPTDCSKSRFRACLLHIDASIVMLSKLYSLYLIPCLLLSATSFSVPHRSLSKSSSLSASVDVVLLGPGDLRLDDHGGFQAAANGDHILPLHLYDAPSLAKLPGATAHSPETAALLHASLVEVSEGLQGNLHIMQVQSSWEDSIAQVTQGYDTVRVHVCDLGQVDNAMGYGAYAQVKDSNRFEVVPWKQTLRVFETPVPMEYPDYEAQFVKDKPAILPWDFAMDLDRVVKVKDNKIPSADEFLSLLPDTHATEANSGLYATHWGGLAPEGCNSVQNRIQAYVDCGEDDAQWSKDTQFPKPTPNPLSLEHASMQWQLGYEECNTQQWLAGESMVRYLAAPLLFGSISMRRVWHMAQQNPLLFVNPLQRLVESREWHSRLAQVAPRNDGETEYKFWRYQGFLCRYAVTDFEHDDASQGVILVHGFGASGSQWNKCMQSLKECNELGAGLAPDLLGFGQSEKPAVSYTGYLWDSMVMDFIKEVALPSSRWDSYVTGGNSIGGFTSMSLAASDAGEPHQVTSSGAPGTNKCSGLVLMNSAGPLFTREELTMNAPAESKAKQTVGGRLNPCSPPPRPVGRAFGNVLLSYLRPRIQSICANLYPTNPAAVNDSLCDNIRRDSLDPGAINVMMAGAKLPTPRSANELLHAEFGGPSEEECSFSGPVLVAQGVLDPLNDSQDRLERLGAMRNGITMDPIQAGHCPHDELPESVAASISKWVVNIKSASVQQAVSEASTIPR